MIEVFIRAEDGLCREVVKHLNQIEEQILDHLAWKSESPLWDRIRDNENRVPTCEEVCERILTSFYDKKHITIYPIHNSLSLTTIKLSILLISVGGQQLGVVWYSHLWVYKETSQMGSDRPKVLVMEWEFSAVSWFPNQVSVL